MQVCCLDLVATREEARHQGHARALLTSLSTFLAASGAARQLVAVVDEGAPGSSGSHIAAAAARFFEDQGLGQGQGQGQGVGQGPAGGRQAGHAERMAWREAARDQAAARTELWQHHLGFTRMSKRQVAALRRRYPLLQCYSPRAEFYTQHLTPPRPPTSHPTPAGAAGLPHSLSAARATGAAGPEGSLLGLPQSQGQGLLGQEERQGEGRQTRLTSSRRRGGSWRLRLWGWAARKMVAAASFGILS
ncbi:hypothetical protein QJQ45_023300 [Haematococcus lacustris]|nr:hypothetical protein QJQ45_023300 [Haematococcus lacustris]